MSVVSSLHGMMDLVFGVSHCSSCRRGDIVAAAWLGVILIVTAKAYWLADWLAGWRTS